MKNKELYFSEINSFKELKETGIYKIKNKLNNKFYIGSASYKNGILKRLRYHKLTLLNNSHSNKHLQSVVNKYGIENFIITVLEFCEPEKCIEREQYYLDLLNPEYNILKFARIAKGCILSEEARNKISSSKKELYSNPEERIKMSNILKGRIFSDETKQKMSISKKGKPLSDLARINSKISVSKKIIQLSKEGNFIREWESITLAAKSLKMSATTIIKSLKNRTKTSGKFKLIYL